MVDQKITVTTPLETFNPSVPFNWYRKELHDRVKEYTSEKQYANDLINQIEYDMD
jgi:hypothetical protein